MGGNRVNLKNVPTAAWVVGAVAFLGVLAAYVVLAVTGADSTEFRSFLNTAANLGALLLGGGSVVYAGAAAKNSQDTKDQTNGQLDDRITEAVRKANEQQKGNL